MTKPKILNVAPKSYEETYASLVTLKRDLYYKEVISANKDVLVRHTTERIEDIFHQYTQNYISKNDMFSELEDLRCKNQIIDQIVYEQITYARKTFCKQKPKKSPKRK
jgi:hypothetical protein